MVVSHLRHPFWYLSCYCFCKIYSHSPSFIYLAYRLIKYEVISSKFLMISTGIIFFSSSATLFYSGHVITFKGHIWFFISKISIMLSYAYSFRVALHLLVLSYAQVDIFLIHLLCLFVSILIHKKTGLHCYMPGELPRWETVIYLVKCLPYIESLYFSWVPTNYFSVLEKYLLFHISDCKFFYFPFSLISLITSFIIQAFQLFLTWVCNFHLLQQINENRRDVYSHFLWVLVEKMYFCLLFYILSILSPHVVFSKFLEILLSNNSLISLEWISVVAISFFPSFLIHWILNYMTSLPSCDHYPYHSFSYFTLFLNIYFTKI